MTEATPTVAVVGLGAVGAMTLLTLARRGVNVIGIDRAEPGHDDAAYGGGTRQVRLAGRGSHAAEHTRWIGETLDLWRRFEADIEDRFYFPYGNVSVGPDDHPDIVSTLTSLDAEGLRYEVHDSQTAPVRFPQHRLEEGEIAVYMPDGGVLLSNPAVRAATTKAESLGARIIRGNVIGIDTSASEAVIRLDHETVRSEQVVLTTGPWVTALVPSLSNVVTPREVPSVWVDAAPGASFAPDAFPPGVRRSRTGHDFTFLPSMQGAGAKFVHWSPMRPAAPMETTGDRGVNQSIVDATLDSLERTLTGSSGIPREAKSYAEGFTRDRWPIIDKVDERTTLLTGFSGGGFALAPVMAETAADLALSGSTSRDIRSFRLDRASLAAPPEHLVPSDAAI